MIAVGEGNSLGRGLLMIVVVGALVGLILVVCGRDTNCNGGGRGWLEKREAFL